VPGILQLRPETVGNTLLANDWLSLGPAAVPDLLMFDTPQPRGDRPNILLPLKLEHGPQIQQRVELVTEVALEEDCSAVDVLNDLLQQTAELTPANGSSAPAQAESMAK